MPKNSFWKNTIKYYAKKYDISVLDGTGNFKSVNQLSNDIYEYEKKERPKNPMYPFLEIKEGYFK